MRRVGRSQGYRQQVSKPTKLPPESLSWYWHPSRVGVAGAFAFFEKKLEDLDPNLAITRDNYNQVWCIWLRAPRFAHKLCWGWKLLFTEKVLGDHIFARLYEASTDRWGSGKKYFEAIQREFERDREMKEKQSTQDTVDQAMESFEHSRIKVSGCGASNGSKFSTYHT